MVERAAPEQSPHVSIREENNAYQYHSGRNKCFGRGPLTSWHEYKWQFELALHGISEECNDESSPFE
eukprot:3435940-Amphidinium_carterae.1